LTLAELAKRSGVHLVTLARIESGKYDPRLSTVLKIAKALKVKVSDLVEGSQPKEKLK
jgi:DNA-binding XRE family transcriptional regulator